MVSLSHMLALLGFDGSGWIWEFLPVVLARFHSLVLLELVPMVFPIS